MSSSVSSKSRKTNKTNNKSIPHTSAELTKISNCLYTIRNNLRHLFDQRGYEYNLEDETVENIRHKLVECNGNDIDLSELRIVVNNGSTTVMFIGNTEGEKIGISIARVLVDLFSTLKHVLLIFIQNVTPSVVKILDNYVGDCRVEYFMYKELMFVVTNHVLVPLHEKLTQNEEDELMKQIMSTKDKLPVLLHSDPVSRFLGFLPGDVIRITRRTSYSPKYFSYRIVKKITTS